MTQKRFFLAFVTYVRPILEYEVESVQRRFMGMAELQYSERLAILGAEALELRRLKADLMYIILWLAH